MTLNARPWVARMALALCVAGFSGISGPAEAGPDKLHRKFKKHLKRDLKRHLKHHKRHHHHYYPASRYYYYGSPYPYYHGPYYYSPHVHRPYRGYSFHIYF